MLQTPQIVGVLLLERAVLPPRLVDFLLQRSDVGSRRLFQANCLPPHFLVLALQSKVFLLQVLASVVDVSGNLLPIKRLIFQINKLILKIDPLASFEADRFLLLDEFLLVHALDLHQVVSVHRLLLDLAEILSVLGLAIEVHVYQVLALHGVALDGRLLNLVLDFGV